MSRKKKILVAIFFQFFLPFSYNSLTVDQQVSNEQGKAEPHFFVRA